MTLAYGSWLSGAAGVAVLMMTATMALDAQPRGGGRGAPRYDPATEATVTGTVQSVEQMTGPRGGRGRRGLGGTHLTLNTGTETLEVHLGPTVVLTEQRVVVVKGDTLEIVGSRVTVDDDRIFIAKTVNPRA